jgi:hypothetical protein
MWRCGVLVARDGFPVWMTPLKPAWSTCSIKARSVWAMKLPVSKLLFDLVEAVGIGTDGEVTEENVFHALVLRSEWHDVLRPRAGHKSLRSQTRSGQNDHTFPVGQKQES